MDTKKKLLAVSLGMAAISLLVVGTGAVAIVQEAPPDLPEKVKRWWDKITRYAGTWNIDPVFFAALIQQESSGDQYAQGQGSTATGLGQVTMPTARTYGFTGTREQLYDPDVNLFYSAKILSDCLARNNGDYWSAAFTYYSGGIYPNSQYLSGGIKYANSVSNNYNNFLV